MACSPAAGIPMMGCCNQGCIAPVVTAFELQDVLTRGFFSPAGSFTPDHLPELFGAVAQTGWWDLELFAAIDQPYDLTNNTIVAGWFLSEGFGEVLQGIAIDSNTPGRRKTIRLKVDNGSPRCWVAWLHGFNNHDTNNLRDNSFTFRGNYSQNQTG